MPSYDLIRFVLDLALGGGLVATLYRLHIERKLRFAQVASTEAGTEKYRAEIHRSDIETMAVVVKSVRERYSELERERDDLRKELNQLKELLRAIHEAEPGCRLLEELDDNFRESLRWLKRIET